MKTPTVAPNSRIDSIDALRGSALLGILLVHSVEHWDFYHPPEHTPDWLKAWGSREALWRGWVVTLEISFAALIGSIFFGN